MSAVAFAYFSVAWLTLSSESMAVKPAVSAASRSRLSADAVSALFSLGSVASAAWPRIFAAIAFSLSIAACWARASSALLPWVRAMIILPSSAPNALASTSRMLVRRSSQIAWAFGSVVGLALAVTVADD